MKKLLLSLLLLSSLLADTVAYNQKVVQAKPQTDKSGNESFNTIFGEQTTAERLDFINVQFQYNNGIGVDVKEENTGTGYNDNADAMAAIHTGASLGTAKITSRDTNRYVTGHDCVTMFTTIHPIPEAGTYTRHAYGDESNYVGFGNNETEFGIWKNFDGDIEFIPQSEWNEKLPKGYTLDATKLNIYMVNFGWLGIAPIQMKIYGGSKYGWITVHTFDTPNTRIKPHLGNPVLPIHAKVGRTSGSGDIVLKTASWRAGIVGKSPTKTLANRPHQTFITKAIPGGDIDTPVISIYNQDNFQGKTNHVRVRYGTVNIATDGTKAVKIKVFRNGTLTTPSWVNFNTYETPAQYDITSTTYTPGILIGGALSGKVDRQRINLFDNDVIIAVYPGETVTLTAASANATEVEIFLRVLSEF